MFLSDRLCMIFLIFITTMSPSMQIFILVAINQMVAVLAYGKVRTFIHILTLWYMMCNFLK